MNILSTFFVALPVALLGCGGEPAVPKPQGTPLQIYDRAVALYFKAPRDPQKALLLLAGACTHIEERRAQSCYNWGLLLEMEGKDQEARGAYRRAVQIERLPVYESALWASDPSQKPDSTKLAAVRAAAEQCRLGRSGAALSLLQNAVAAAPKAGWSRELVAQPFFAQCLEKEARYKSFRDSLNSAGGDLRRRYASAVAAADDFRAMWDLEARLSGREGQSSHRTTRAWLAALRMAAQGNGPGAASALAEFKSSLPRDGANAERSLAMHRAAALLIRQTRYFARVRAHPGVAGFANEVLK